ncbi:hypothetical protein I862_03825 [endosymbiont of Acanthamoeba sp. UWC8]|uniref:hypothetical protein n=1 Tax=endosymbiont of Acanthamoeba sp. UWC8 TaxID=86106 RepID=UPI0004D0B69A|nr:hypothetical protein [endosymbiont of Acanthamoeba sp. UWC8]AIF81325.1 hypothetical protein I862_03825 [endosymbiont of Acanthamoeba sp. UWC8]
MAKYSKTFTLDKDFIKYAPVDRYSKSSSINTYIYKLKDEESSSNQSLWIIKENINSWIIREFIAGGIYKYFLGDNASTMMLVKDSKYANQIKLAVKYINNFHQFDNYGYEVAAKINADSIPFDCVIGGCEIQGGILKHNSINPSIYNGKPVLGFEVATILSIFIDDRDIDNGINYALINGGDSLKVTRFDYDDSFSFMVPTRVVSDHHLLPWQIQYMIDAQYIYYSLAAPGYLKTKFGKELVKKIDSEKLLEALDAVASTPIAEIRKIIHERMEVVSSYYSSNQLNKIFNFKKLKEFTPEATNTANALESLLVKVLDDRLDELKTTRNCFEVELAALGHNQTKLSELENFMEDGEQKCTSMYQDYEAITPYELVNLYKFTEFNDEL